MTPSYSRIEFTVLANSESDRLVSTQNTTTTYELEYIKGRVKWWFETEARRYSEPRYSDSFTLHCAKNAEYILFAIKVFRGGGVGNIGKVMLTVTSSLRGGFERVTSTKFKYSMDKEDMNKYQEATSSMLDTMSDLDFNSGKCMDAINDIFSSFNQPITQPSQSAHPT